MSDVPLKQPTNNFRLYWRYIRPFKDDTRTILYRIDDVLVYRIDLSKKKFTIRINQGEAIPKKADPISKEEYERQILKYML